MTGHAWFKTLPAEWALVELKWVARIYSGGTPDRSRPEFWTDGDIPWLASGCVNQWKVTEPSEYITKKGFEASSARFVPRGAVLIGLAGQGKTKGTAALSLIEATINQSVAAIVCGSALDPRFLHYWLSVNHSNIRGLSGGDLRDGLNHGHVGAIPVPLPPRVLQTRIADYLDRETATIDALIAKQVELMNRLRERRQAVIDRAFVSTSEIVILRRHLVLNDSGAWGEDPTGADDVAVLRSTEQTVDGYWAISDPALRTLSQTERQNTRLREGDLIVTKTSGSFKHVGKTTLVDNEVAEGGYGFGNFMQRLRLKSTMIPKFLWWFMRTDQARSWINLVATTSTGLMNLNGSTLGRMEVPLPSLVEQREIADHLDRETAKIDALIAKAERFIELAQERRAALITAVVTGQIEIPTED